MRPMGWEMNKPDVRPTVASLRQQLAEKNAEIERLRAALLSISEMGRVCPEFEVCTHPWCSDSCGAVLVALEALNPIAASTRLPQ
jgi:hypothetical protein